MRVIPLHRPGRVFALLVAGPAVLLAVLTPATRETDGATGREPPIGAIPIVRTDSDIVLPLDAVFQTPGQKRRVSRALDVLGRACMRGFGLDRLAVAPPTGASDPRVTRNARRYTVLDRTRVATEGYHPVELIKAEKAALQYAASRPVASPASRDVWLGNGRTHYRGRPVPAGGCVGEAARQLHAGIETVDATVLRRIDLESFHRMITDSRVRSAFAGWSACMTGKGHNYPDPVSAFTDRRWRGPEITPAEIAVALDDVACKTRGNVGGTMLAVEAAYQLHLIDRHAAQVAAIKTFLDAEAASANQILAGAHR
jgi:hypothetical protein